tara:strand:+ start:19 stop:468 length:450 start_codon:yes stop_codon:yes gene_type:complete
MAPKDENILTNIVKTEEHDIIDFLTSFEIIGLTVASIIGIAVSSFGKSFSEEILMPALEYISSNNLKSYVINIGCVRFNIGIFLKDLIYLIFTIVVMATIYSLFKKNLSMIMQKKTKNKNKGNTSILSELTSIKNELVKLNEVKLSNEF